VIITVKATCFGGLTRQSGVPILHNFNKPKQKYAVSRKRRREKSKYMESFGDIPTKTYRAIGLLTRRSRLAGLGRGRVESPWFMFEAEVSSMHRSTSTSAIASSKDADEKPRLLLSSAVVSPHFSPANGEALVNFVLNNCRVVEP
jgi:hypothetical protein